MKRTVTMVAALTAAMLFGCAQQFAGIKSMRGADVAASDSAAPAKVYVGEKPGLQKPIARTFDGQPPLIPHTVNNFDEITLEENQCMSCHSREKFKEKNAPVVGESHFINPATGQKLAAVSMARHNCTQCHVPQVDAPPLVDNKFQGVVTPR
ncbi:MAG TPA: nitrate reductase cytochrome c-type subunit [Rhodocyclaceae bacterium]|nr:nitrate reductase cytochrome c-type subunit [Rhodocyclaceae bacterium]